MEGIEDLSKMKVADLKKHLKNKGLSVAGNKTELVERLQEALKSDVADDNPTLEPTEGDDDEFDEEEILGGDDDDMDKITQEEEAAALAGNLKVKEDLPKPAPKKISLKRSTPSLSSSTTEPETPEVKTVKPVVEEKESVTSNTEEESTKEKEDSDAIAEVEPKHKKIKLTGATDENALEARAKKFGSAADDKEKVKDTNTDEGRRLSRASRFGIDATVSSSTNGKNKRAPKLSMEVGTTDLDKLKKRAERFGEVTSKSLSKVEELEKKKQRSDRFGEEAKSDEKTEEKKSETEKEKDVSSDSVKTETKENGTTTTKDGTAKVAITAPAAEGDAKLKRAQRFA